MKVHRIMNKPISSNCYLIVFDSTLSCIVVDPGTKGNTEMLAFLTSKNLSPALVILTHEHFDHCAGVDDLTTHYNFRLIASEQSAVRIQNRKTNLSAYNEAAEPIEVLHPVDIVYNDGFIEFDNYNIMCVQTPGHSPGSMCYIIDNLIFTGDTLLNSTKTPLKLPGSNKEQHKESLNKLKNYLMTGMIIYPGHGEPFTFSSEFNL